MARSVYADPFGSYVQGYDTGAQREMALQRGVRDARGMDWDFYNMKPLELQTAQRQNELGVAAQPYSLKMPEIGYRNARNAAFLGDIKAAEPMAWLGMPGPFNEAIQRQTGYASAGTPGNMQYYMPSGEAAGAPVTPELINPYYFRDEYRATDQFNKNYGLQQTEVMQRQQQQQLMADQEARLRAQQMGENGTPAGMSGFMTEWFGAPAPAATSTPTANPNLQALGGGPPPPAANLQSGGGVIPPPNADPRQLNPMQFQAWLMSLPPETRNALLQQVSQQYNAPAVK